MHIEKRQKRNSAIFLSVLLLVCFLTFVYFKDKWNSGSEVIITINGETYGKYPLSVNRTIEVKNGEYINIVEIKDRQVSVTYSNCDNQICVNEPAISEEFPLVIVCLPHEMVVELSER